MTLGSTALTTLALLKARLGISDSNSDTLLEALINVASESIASYCGRAFEYVADDEEYIQSFGTQRLRVSRAPIWSIDEISYDGSVVAADSYEVRARDKYAGLIYAKHGWPWSASYRLGTIAQDPIPGTERHTYLVTYTAGFQTPSQSPVVGVDVLPLAIQEACIAAATSLYARVGQDPAVQSESLLSYSVTYDTAARDGAFGLPPLAQALLGPYRFFTFG